MGGRNIRNGNGCIRRRRNVLCPADHLVLIFANADQISALVTMQGFHNGKAVNTLAPFGAACHSIVYAAEQIDKEEPGLLVDDNAI